MWIALACLGIVLIGVTGFLALQPGSFSVRRSLDAKATLETVFAAIVDLRGWPAWSPWLLHEPDARLRFSDDCRQEEGYFEWDGALVGAGRLTHARIVPNQRIEQQLDFRRPFKSTSKVRWTFEAHDRQTRVNWEMAGRMPFLFRFMTRSTTAQVERDYELGLALLHGYLNRDAAHPSLHFDGEESLDDFNYWAIPFDGKLRQLEATRRQHIEALEAASGGKAGLPLTLFHGLEPNAVNYTAEIAIPIADSVPASNYIPRHFGGGRYFKLALRGDHQFLPLAWHALFNHCQMRRIRHDKTRPALEIYQDDPVRTENSNEINSALYLPIR